MKLLLIIFLFTLPTVHQTQNDKLAYHTEKADQYYHKGDFPNMLYHLIEKIKIDKHDVSTYCDISYYYWSMSINDSANSVNYRKKALHYLKLGLEYNKNSAYMWDEIGNYYLRAEKDNKSAKYYLNKAISKKDAPLSSFHSLAFIYIKEKQNKEAIVILKRCLNKYPNDKKAEAKISELNSNLNN